MPAPPASLMQQLAKAQFRALAPRLPLDWQQPQGDPAGKHYHDAFKPGELTHVPSAGALFMPASTNKYHCQAAKEISEKFEAYIDGICSAICSAWSQWQSTASMVGIVINAVTAVGGQVVGPPWFPLILASAPKSTPQELKYSNAIAQAISTGWLSYQSSIKVPGLPWYPAFAAVPSPVAPPVPNVPMPVAALMQVPVTVSGPILKSQMIGNLADPQALHAQELFESVAGAFEKCFQMWQVSTMVTNVIGTGPVPTFAPPVVPVGPVVGGIGNMIPGGFK